MIDASKTSPAHVATWRHARAILLLPFVTTVVVPAAIVALGGAELLAPIDRGGVRLVIGAALVGAGAALVAHCVRLLARLGHGTLAPWDPTRALVADGAYRHVRNPMKIGLFAILLGEAVALRSLPLLGWFACFALANIVYIRLHEERGLLERFGPDYREYCADVPRWLPRRRAARARASSRSRS